jgi:cAMP-dependent protein kinase regulator
MMHVTADAKRPFREPSPCFTELTSSFNTGPHPLSSDTTTATNVNGNDGAAPSSPTRTDASAAARQPPPLSTILSPSEQKKKKLIDSPFVIRQSVLASATDPTGRKNSIFEIVSHPMLDTTSSPASYDDDDDVDDDTKKKKKTDSESNNTQITTNSVKVDLNGSSSDQDDDNDKKVTCAIPPREPPAVAATLLSSRRSSLAALGRGAAMMPMAAAGSSTGMGLEALKRLGLGERQVSQRWSSLLRTSNAVAVAKRKFAPKKTKLNNLWADKLDDDEPFHPPVFEKNAADKALVREAMKHNFVFDTSDPLVLDRLADAMELVEFAAGETIIQQGDKGDYFYAITEGEVDFFVDQVRVGSAPAGRSFGELALLYTCHRAATAKASTTIGNGKTTLYRMDQKSFRHILKDQMKHSRRDKLQLLHKIKPFRDLEKSDLKVLAAAMEPIIFEKGDVVWMKGDPSPRFCAVQEGELAFTNITIGNRECKDKKLGPGDYFGEQTLGNRDPAEGTVTALTRVLAFCIDRQTFDRDFGGLKRLVDKSIDKRRLVRVILFVSLPTYFVDRNAAVVLFSFLLLGRIPSVCSSLCPFEYCECCALVSFYLFL